MDASDDESFYEGSRHRDDDGRCVCSNICCYLLLFVLCYVNRPAPWVEKKPLLETRFCTMLSGTRYYVLRALVGDGVR